jgi:hypothetical protein
MMAAILELEKINENYKENETIKMYEYLFINPNQLSPF